MPVLLRILAALVLTFWISRLTLRMPNPWRKNGALMLAHGVSFVLSSVLLIVLRAPIGVFAPRQLLIILAAQLCWLVFDRMRHAYPGGSAATAD